MPQFHAADCWCETCRRFRERIEALEAELAGALAENEELFQSRDRYSAAWKRATEELAAARHTIAVLQEALGIDTSPPSEAELAYARQLEEAGR